MIYFDTDVLVNYCVEQEPIKHQQAIQLIEQAITNGLFFISTLSLNELAFALTKVRVKVSRDEITGHLNDFYLLNPVPVTLEQMQRAAEIAYRVSFSHMSDCVHTAVAEEFCDRLYTYNRSDFQLIQHHTKLKITIL
ncbi:hypothetical protein GCM10027341_00640 [Spirosoma knui]